MAIVAATDLSANSEAAITAAAALAARWHDGQLSVIHVLEPWVGALDAADQQRLRETALRRIHEQLGGVQADVTVEIGPVAETVLRFADERKAAALVVASKGYDTTPVYRIGGTSERIARSARLPVLVVRDPGPFLAWGRRPLRVLLAVDGSRSSLPAIGFARELRKAGPCDVVVGHIYYAGEATHRYGLPPNPSLITPNREAELLIARDLSELVGELGGEGAVTYAPRIGLGRPGNHLLELAENESADVIVVGTHQKRGLGRLTSTSSIVLHFAHSSVVCVPEVEAATPEELPRIDRVLVATDFSPVSSEAVRQAYALVQGRGGEVWLLHVAPEKGSFDEAALVARLRGLAPRAIEGVVTRTEVVRCDDTGTGICRAAERLAADVVCVGTRGRSGVAAMLGSVAQDVLRSCRKPVLVIRGLAP